MSTPNADQTYRNFANLMHENYVVKSSNEELEIYDFDIQSEVFQYNFGQRIEDVIVGTYSN